MFPSCQLLTGSRKKAGWWEWVYRSTGSGFLFCTRLWWMFAQCWAEDASGCGVVKLWNWWCHSGVQYRQLMAGIHGMEATKNFIPEYVYWPFFIRCWRAVLQRWLGWPLNLPWRMPTLLVKALYRHWRSLSQGFGNGNVLSRSWHQELCMKWMRMYGMKYRLVVERWLIWPSCLALPSLELVSGGLTMRCGIPNTDRWYFLWAFFGKAIGVGGCCRVGDEVGGRRGGGTSLEQPFKTSGKFVGEAGNSVVDIVLQRFKICCKYYVMRIAYVWEVFSFRCFVKADLGDPCFELRNFFDVPREAVDWEASFSEVWCGTWLIQEWTWPVSGLLLTWEGKFSGSRMPKVMIKVRSWGGRTLRAWVFRAAVAACPKNRWVEGECWSL